MGVWVFKGNEMIVVGGGLITEKRLGFFVGTEKKKKTESKNTYVINTTGGKRGQILNVSYRFLDL